MKEFIEGKIYKRVVLDREIDGRFDRLSCEVGEERCDVCKGKAGARKRRRVEIEEDIEELGYQEVRMSPSRFQEISESEFEDSGIGLREEEEEDEEEKIIREEFEDGRRAEDMIRWKRIEEKVEAGVKVEGLVEVLDRWQGRCVVYKAKGSLVQEEHE